MLEVALALRLTSKLVDLRAGQSNPAALPLGSDPLSLHQKKKSVPRMRYGFLWRRDRDSNPRCSISAYTISSRAP